MKQRDANYSTLLLQDCKQDNASRKVYKMLMQLDVECRQIVSMIEEAGATVREIRDLEEQVVFHYITGMLHFSWFLFTCINEVIKKNPSYLTIGCRKLF